MKKIILFCVACLMLLASACAKDEAKHSSGGNASTENLSRSDFDWDSTKTSPGYTVLD